MRARVSKRETLKFGISLWHIDKRGVVLTERDREREREREILENFMYCSCAWTSSVFC